MTQSIRIRLPEFPRSDHYSTISRVIHFLRENYRDQPSLSQVASIVGLSPKHLLETFRQWAGITPKQFLKIVTITEAKRHLLKDLSTHETSWECGLSGPSRLYDLFVSVDAVTPGEFKRMGKDLLMNWGIHSTPFGPCLAVVSPRGLTHLQFPEKSGVDEQLENIRINWPFAHLVHRPEATRSYVDAIFHGKTTSEPFSVFLKGTPFQIKVWQALIALPNGTTTAYSKLATQIGCTTAHRACASAVGNNPIAYLIPCHRVLRKSMALGGYRWGLDRKCAILATELTED